MHCAFAEYYVRANSLQSCPTLWDPMDGSPPGSSVRGILQARLLEWVAVPSSWGTPDPGIKPTSLISAALTGRLFTTSPTVDALSLCFYILVPGEVSDKSVNQGYATPEGKH